VEKDGKGGPGKHTGFRKGTGSKKRGGGNIGENPTTLKSTENTGTPGCCREIGQMEADEEKAALDNHGVRQ